MSTPGHVVVIGGGLAGAKTVEALREQGFDGAVTQLAAESHLPYERPPLSKGYLQGEATFDEAIVHPEKWYTDNRVDLRRDTTATAVDAAQHQVRLADDTTLDYDKLVLATGATPKKLPLPGADADGVHYLRTKEDSDSIHATFGQGKRLIVIGGGWIGLEVAAAARGAETAVTLIESADLPLLGVLGPELAKVFADLHRDHDVDLRVGAQVSAIVTKDGTATGVELATGETIDADAIVIGVGVAPDVSLAESAGLSIDNGVLADASLRSSDPDIYVVGDIANHDHPVLKQRVRVEHWATALNQPAAAVSALLGQDTQYTELPYFFSDQYDLGMEYIGFAPHGSYAQVVIRGDLDKREFVAFWLDGDNKILAAMNVNVWDVVDEVKPLIAAGKTVDPEQLKNPDVAYSSL